MRLLAQQAVLDAAYDNKHCIVAVQQYDPARQSFDFSKRKRLAAGDFSAFSARVLRVGEALNLAGHQETVLYGYSFGGDVAVQTAHDILFNQNRGVMPLPRRLGANECARTMIRGAIAVTRAMGDSGKELFANICESDCPALLEAWQIQRQASERDQSAQEKARAAFDRRIGHGVIRFWLRHVVTNLATTQGFGTNASAVQLSEILGGNHDICTLVGRQQGSTICPVDFFCRVASKQTLDTAYRK